MPDEIDVLLDRAEDYLHSQPTDDIDELLSRSADYLGRIPVERTPDWLQSRPSRTPRFFRGQARGIAPEQFGIDPRQMVPATNEFQRQVMLGKSAPRDVYSTPLSELRALRDVAEVAPRIFLPYNFLPDRPETEQTPQALQERSASALAQIAAHRTSNWDDLEPDDRLRVLNEKREAFGLPPASKAPDRQTFSEWFIDKFTKQGFRETLPFLSGIESAAGNGALYFAAKRAERGTARPEDLAALVRGMEEVAEQEIGRTFAADVGAAVTDMVPWGVELWLTGGTMAATRAGASGVAKTGLKELAKRQLRHIASTRTAGQILLGMQHRTAAAMFERMTPDYALTPNDAEALEYVATRGGDTLPPALAKALGDTAIEVVSEKTGELMSIGGKALGSWMMKHMPTRVNAALTGALMKAKGWPLAKAGTHFKEFGYNGVLAEIGEERVAEALRTALESVRVAAGGDGTPIGHGFLPGGLRQLGVEATSFLVPGAAGRFITYSQEKLADRAAKMEREAARAIEAAIEFAEQRPSDAAEWLAAVDQKEDGPSRQDLPGIESKRGRALYQLALRHALYGDQPQTLPTGQRAMPSAFASRGAALVPQAAPTPSERSEDAVEPAETPADKPPAPPVSEPAAAESVDLEKMTKRQLIEYARDKHDLRGLSSKKKSAIIETIKQAEVLKQDLEYQHAKRQVAATEAAKQREFMEESARETLEEFERGEYQWEHLPLVPTKYWPRPIRDLVAFHAKKLMDFMVSVDPKYKRSRRYKAIKKVAEGTDTKTTDEMFDERWNILEHLRGRPGKLTKPERIVTSPAQRRGFRGQDDLTELERTRLVHDSMLMKFLMATKADRAQILEETAASIAAGRPNELALEMDDYIATTTGESPVPMLEPVMQMLQNWDAATPELTLPAGSEMDRRLTAAALRQEDDYAQQPEEEPSDPELAFANQPTLYGDMGTDRVAQWALQPPESHGGRQLLDRLKKDSGSKHPRIGILSIGGFVSDLVHMAVIFGRMQTSQRRPAQYDRRTHTARSRTGGWAELFHEAGHGLSQLLGSKAGKWFSRMKADLETLTYRDGTTASAHTAEEGVADLVFLYITDQGRIPPKLRAAFEGIVRQIDADLLEGLRDAHRAYAYHASRPLVERLNADKNDKPRERSFDQRISDFIYRALYTLVGGHPVLHRLDRVVWHHLTGEKGWMSKDPTGLLSISRAWLDKMYKSASRVTREYMRGLENTPADYHAAYQWLQHIPQELALAIGGADHGWEGLRIIATGNGFGRFSDEEIAKLEEVFDIPERRTAHGHWLHLFNKSLRAIKKDVGEENWPAFTVYGQFRTALYRYNKYGSAYPGMEEPGKSPEAIAAWLAEVERENPSWADSYREINQMMNQRLLIPLLMGEKSVDEVVRIAKSMEDYWPLPRQLFDRQPRRSGGGETPSAGIFSQHGSRAQFVETIDEAVEMNLKRALEAYYQNRMRLAMIRAVANVDRLQDIPFERRKAVRQMFQPLRLEVKRVANLKSEEQLKIFVRALNELVAEQSGIPAEQLPDHMRYDVGDFSISLPGYDVFRMRKPDGPSVIGVWENGELKFYQVADPLLFDLFTLGGSLTGLARAADRLGGELARPWKRAFTQNLLFAVKNFFTRDTSTAFLMGNNYMQGFYAAAGAIGRLKGGDIDAPRAESELLSKALDATTREAHKTTVGWWKAMLAEGLELPDLRGMPLGTKALKSALAGARILYNMPFKLIDIFNAASGGRYLSQLSESLPREGAFREAIRRGDSPERAQIAADWITGNFGQKPGSAAVSAVYKAAGFANPAVQIMYGLGTKISHADPKTRLEFFGLRLPLLAIYGGIGAYINWLLIMALFDDDERDLILEQMRERPEGMRLQYLTLVGKIRLPFDYGLGGAVQSWGWNSVERWLLDQPVMSRESATKLFKRAVEPPFVTDVMAPLPKTWLELQLNHSFFYDDEIVPAYLEAAYPHNPELQTWPRMEALYDRMGKHLRVSPIKIKYAARNLLSNRVNDAAQLADIIAGKRDVREPADVPFVGNLAMRDPRGWRSQSVRSLMDLDNRYTAAHTRLRAMASRLERGTPAYDTALKTVRELATAHRFALAIDELYRAAKATKSQETRTKLERRMVTLAKRYWEDHGTPNQ